MLRQLAVQMRGQVERRFAGRDDIDVLDVGCGRRPYAPLVERHAARYVGVDMAPGPMVDVIASADALPFEDGSFDCVLCNQLLEHVESPPAVVSELRRVLRPGGVALASTHGVMRYHPVPEDYWRWTHAGLDRLFRTSADWSEVEVQPNGGVGSALAHMIAWQLQGLAGRTLGSAAAGPVNVAMNALGANYDRAMRRLKPGEPPSIAPNYLVTAVA
jgi:SAM-dependent methyltransferase